MGCGGARKAENLIRLRAWRLRRDEGAEGKETKRSKDQGTIRSQCWASEAPDTELAAAVVGDVRG